jgi:hypothetical protein
MKKQVFIFRTTDFTDKLMMSSGAIKIIGPPAVYKKLFRSIPVSRNELTTTSGSILLTVGREQCSGLISLRLKCQSQKFQSDATV